MSFFLVLLGLYALFSLPLRKRNDRGAVTRHAWIPERRQRAASAAGWFFLGAGLLHFMQPGMYTPMIPAALPHPELWVALSGLAECAGGLGLLVPRTRTGAAWGLVVLLFAIWPANIHVALTGGQVAGMPSASWYYWLRVPFQLVYVSWVLYAGGICRRSARSAGQPRSAR